MTKDQIPFDKQVEKHQAQWRNGRFGDWGTYKGTPHEHILTDEQWMMGLWEPTRAPLACYIAVSGIVPNTFKNNLKSSWTQCANLYFFGRLSSEYRMQMASFLSSLTGLSVRKVERIEFEYCAPGKLTPHALLGEPHGRRGALQTSPDIGIEFSTKDGRTGLYLIENKYTEHSFYDCSVAEKFPRDTAEGCQNMDKVHSDPDKWCYQQHAPWNRKYWHVLERTTRWGRLNEGGACPALQGGFQLLRQHALAQGIADSRLFDIVLHGVSFDERNTVLKQCLGGNVESSFVHHWPELFDTDVRFVCFTHQEFMASMREKRSDSVRQWAEYVTERYEY